jgi:hypothetical protein
MLVRQAERFSQDCYKLESRGSTKNLHICFAPRCKYLQSALIYSNIGMGFAGFAKSLRREGAAKGGGALAAPPAGQP